MKPQLESKILKTLTSRTLGLLTFATAAILTPSAQAACPSMGRSYCVKAEVSEILTKNSGCLAKLTIVKQIVVPVNKARIKYPDLKRFVTAVAPPVTCKNLVPGQVSVGEVRFRCEESESEKLGAAYNFVHGDDDPKSDCAKRFEEQDKKTN